MSPLSSLVGVFLAVQIHVSSCQFMPSDIIPPALFSLIYDDYQWGIFGSIQPDDARVDVVPPGSIETYPIVVAIEKESVGDTKAIITCPLTDAQKTAGGSNPRMHWAIRNSWTQDVWITISSSDNDFSRFNMIGYNLEISGMQWGNDEGLFLCQLVGVDGAAYYLDATLYDPPARGVNVRSNPESLSSLRDGMSVHLECEATTSRPMPDVLFYMVKGSSSALLESADMRQYPDSTQSGYGSAVGTFDFVYFRSIHSDFKCEARVAGVLVSSHTFKFPASVSIISSGHYIFASPITLIVSLLLFMRHAIRSTIIF